MSNSNFEQEKKWLLNEKYNGRKSKEFLNDLEKLKQGYPLAFLIGNQPFLNCKIDLEFKPLIPRPETEFWVDDFMKRWGVRNLASPNSAPTFLDIFSGSGCIGIALLKNIQNCNVDFSEINPLYIKQIKKNIKINNLKKRNYNIFTSDIFKNIPPKKYNCILANPPYISKSSIKQVQKSVLDYEDQNALFANDDGLYFIKKTIIEGQKFLKKNGEIWIEFDSQQEKKIKEFLKNIKYKNYEFWIDQYKKKRVIIIRF